MAPGSSLATHRPLLRLLLHLVAAFGGALLAPTAAAQTELTLLNEYKVQPEVWHFTGPEEPGVDANGDLGLSVPLLRVPGRGLDFDVVLSYRSGIRLEQDAGWVGLGWSLDPGSVTREPEGGAVFQSTQPVGYGVDAFDAPALPPAQPDVFYVTLPGRGTTEFTRINRQGFRFRDFRGYARGDFLPNEQQPWRIHAIPSAGPLQVDGRVTGYGTTPGSSVVRQPDLAGFVFTTEDGVRFLFARPTLAFFETGDHTSIRRQFYAGTWRLVAVLGTDFVRPLPAAGDAFWTTAPASWPADGTPGSWVRLEYGAPVTQPNRADPPDSLARFIQTQYLKAVVTPTHRADFYLSRRLGPTINPAEIKAGLYQRLDSVLLTTLIAGSVVERVHLVHDQEMGPKSGVYGGRLRLNEIRSYGIRRAERPGYRFTYHNTATGPPEGYDGCLDDFGYLLELGNCAGSGGTDAWSLADVRYPTGASETFTYEDDSISTRSLVYQVIRLEEGPSTWTHWAWSRYVVGWTNSRGGARVKRIVRSDGMGGQTETDFEYGPGHLAAVPHGAWARFLPRTPLRVFMPSNRGKTAVYYAWVKKRLAGSGAVTTYYTTPDSLDAMSDALLQRELPVTADELALWQGPVRPVVTAFSLRSFTQGTSFDVVVMQGNQDWNWGRPYRTVTTGIALDGREIAVSDVRHTLAYMDTMAVAVVWPDPYVSVNHTRFRTLATTSRDYDPADSSRQAARYVRYAYDDRTNFTTSTEERFYRPGSPETHWKISEMRYAYDVIGRAYDTLRVRNILQVEVSRDVLERSGTAYGYASASLTTWSFHGGLGFSKPHRHFLWRSDAPQALRPTATFSNWNGGDPPATWQVQVIREAYDANGNLLRQRDAHQIPTVLTYASRYRGARLTQVDRAGLRVQLEYSLRSGLDTLLVDETGRRTSYSYDFLGRLTGIQNHDRVPVASFAYTPSVRNNGAFNPANPNRLVSTMHLSSGRSVATVEYFDGMARPIQVHTPHAAGLVVAATQYDAQGRPWRAWKPYPSPPQPYDPAFATRAEAYYDGVSGRPQDNGRPFSETFYHVDPLRHVARVHPEGDGAWAATSTYGVALLDGRPYSFSETVDEEGQTVRAYQDALGNTVRRSTLVFQEDPLFWEARAIGGPTRVVTRQQIRLDQGGTVAWSCTLTTRGGGQAAFRITYVEGGATLTLASRASDDRDQGCAGAFWAKPGVVYTMRAEGLALRPDDVAVAEGEAVHRRRGALVRSHDTGFDYDVVGNLRGVMPPNFFDPPNGRPADWRITYRYNTLGQRVEKQSPDDSVAHRYAYDAVGRLRRYQDPNRHGWGFVYSNFDDHHRLVESGVCRSASFSTSAVVSPGEACDGAKSEVMRYVYDTATPGRQAGLDWPIEYPLGHLTQVEYDGGYELYSYDREGRLAGKYVGLTGLGGKRVRYGYDLQGNVTEVHYQPGEEDGFTLTYEYDEAGRLWVVSSHTPDQTSPGGQRVAVREALYGYEPSGHVRSLQLGADTVRLPAVDYRYHIRGWLTAINDPAAGSAEPFALALGYARDGNVTETEWATRGNAVGGARVRFHYAYDALDRLNAADFSDYRASGTVGWGDSPLYDVGPITYDANGNITAYTHRGIDGAGQPVTTALGYAYGGSNRLQSLSGSLNTHFAYDANGNMTSGRGLSRIAYDHRNLPTRMEQGSGNAVTFRYDAGGQRVFKQSTRGAASYDIRGADGAVLAVYDETRALLYWNVVAAGRVIGRIAFEAVRSGTYP